MHDDSVNYLHFGSALQNRESVRWELLQGLRQKTDVVTTIGHDNAAQTDLIKLIRSYGRTRSRMFDVGRFQQEMGRSLIYQSKFKALCCRGFSYRVENDIEFPEPFAKHITLRLALVTSEELFYPPRVKSYLRRVNNNHYFSRGFPSIAFALGTVRGDDWFIYVLQSDLAIRSPSYVRGHFRGWARVLLSTILEKARGRAKAIHICRASDALRTCHPSFSRPREVPSSWQCTYDATAAFWRMQLVCVQALNIQLYPQQKPILARRFYRLNSESFGESTSQLAPGAS
jgi:hypothetical protein